MAQTLSIADTGSTGRQDILHAKAILKTGTGYDTVTQGTFKCIAIPAGAQVLSGYVYCSDATSSSVTVTVGDGGSAARYLGSTSVASTGLTALVPTGYQYTQDDTIDIVVAGANAAADGVIELHVNYVVDGRCAFVQK
jgi:hypothetical protein